MWTRSLIASAALQRAFGRTPVLPDGLWGVRKNARLSTGYGARLQALMLVWAFAQQALIQRSREAAADRRAGR
ncbi:MAG TPA: hypothetical protein VGG86_11180 [Roseiarcus sp.]